MIVTRRHSNPLAPQYSDARVCTRSLLRERALQKKFMELPAFFAAASGPASENMFRNIPGGSVR